MKHPITAISMITLALAGSTPAWAEPVDVEAVIISQSGNQISARTRQGDVTIVYDTATKIREKDGLQKKTRGSETLIPGLIIQVEGDQQGTMITASEIDYKNKDWRMAVSTKAGTMEEFNRNAAQISQLRQAMIDGQEYEIQQEATVYFASGSTAISAGDKEKLKSLAGAAPSFTGYRISILGYADPRGDAAANERLSLKRAAGVSNYLRQTGHIQPGRVLSPTAMGEGALAPGDTAPTNDAEARRVVVRIVTPKGQLTQ